MGQKSRMSIMPVLAGWLVAWVMVMAVLYRSVLADLCSAGAPNRVSDGQFEESSLSRLWRQGTNNGGTISIVKATGTTGKTDNLALHLDASATPTSATAGSVQASVAHRSLFLKAGDVFTFTAYVQKLNPKGVFTVTLSTNVAPIQTFTIANGETTTASGPNGWRQITASFTPVPTQRAITFKFTAQDGANVLVDDVSVCGPAPSGTARARRAVTDFPCGVNLFKDTADLASWNPVRAVLLTEGPYTFVRLGGPGTALDVIPSIHQTITTTVGTAYRVSAQFRGSNALNGVVVTSSSGEVKTFTAPPSTNSPTAGGWHTLSFSFIATAGSTDITFRHLSPTVALPEAGHVDIYLPRCVQLGCEYVEPRARRAIDDGQFPHAEL